MNKLKLGLATAALGIAAYGAYEVREAFRSSIKDDADVLPQTLAVSKGDQKESIQYGYDLFSYGKNAAIVRPMRSNETARTSKGTLENRLNFAFIPETEATQIMNLTDNIVNYNGTTYIPVSTGKARTIELRAPTELNIKNENTDKKDATNVMIKELKIQTRNIDGTTYIITPFDELTEKTLNEYAKIGSTEYLPFGLLEETTAKVGVVRKNASDLGTVLLKGQFYIPIKANIVSVTPTPTPVPTPSPTPVPTRTPRPIATLYVTPTITPTATPSPTPDYRIVNP